MIRNVYIAYCFSFAHYYLVFLDVKQGGNFSVPSSVHAEGYIQCTTAVPVSIEYISCKCMHGARYKLKTKSGIQVYFYHSCQRIGTLAFFFLKEGALKVKRLFFYCTH